MKLFTFPSVFLGFYEFIHFDGPIILFDYLSNANSYDP